MPGAGSPVPWAPRRPLPPGEGKQAGRGRTRSAHTRRLGAGTARRCSPASIPSTPPQQGTAVCPPRSPPSASSRTFAKSSPQGIHPHALSPSPAARILPSRPSRGSCSPAGAPGGGRLPGRGERDGEGSGRKPPSPQLCTPPHPPFKTAIIITVVATNSEQLKRHRKRRGPLPARTRTPGGAAGRPRGLGGMLGGRLGTLPTSAAGGRRGPAALRCSPLEVSPPAAPGSPPPPGLAPPGGAGCGAEALPGAAVARRAPPHAASAPPSPAPPPRSSAHMRGEDPSAHGRPLPSHCSRPPLARSREPPPLRLAHRRTHARRGKETPLRGGKPSTSQPPKPLPHTPLPFPERCRAAPPGSSGGCGGAGGAPRGGESGGAPLLLPWAAAATSAARGTAGTGPARPRPPSTAVLGKAERGKERKERTPPPLLGFSDNSPLPRLETKVEVETEWAGR